MRIFAFILITALVQAVGIGQQPLATSGPVSTGKILSIDPAHGILIMHSDQTHAPITFVGMDRASVQTTSGRAVTIKEVQPQQDVTVHYAVAGNRWVVGKVVIPDATNPVRLGEAPAVSLTPGERRALESKAANDGDITTKPGVKARIDNDITTQPGKVDPATNTDITKRPDSR